MFLLDAH